MPAKRKKNYIKTGMTLGIMVIAVVLTIFSIVMTYDTTYNNLLLDDANPLSSTITQSVGAVLGIIGMFILSHFDYHRLQKPVYLVLGWVIVTGMLIAVFFFAPRNDSHRWIWLPMGLSLQPSEFAKFIAVLYTAHYMTQKPGWYARDRIRGWIGLLLPSCVFLGLIFMEPNLSTTLCVLMTVVAMTYIGGAPFWHLLLGGGAGGAGLLLIKVLSGDYQSNRLKAWLHAWDNPSGIGYQVVQSLYAIGDGGVFGVGFGNSKQKINALPMCDTDYIFSVICEEFGFIGAILLLLIYILFIYLGLRAAYRAPDKFGCYLAAGITISIGLQAFLNMAVATNVAPSTGVTLPFVSHGTTSLVITLCATGLLLNVSSYAKRPSALTEDD